MTAPETVPTTAAPPPSRYSLGSLPNMLRSLLFIGLLVAALVAIVPRISEVQRPAVDALGKARATIAQTGGTLELPEGLGAGWLPTVATFAPGTENVPTFTTVWETPEGGDIALKEASEATEGWVSRSVNDGTRDGSVTVAGRTFERYVARGGSQISYVERGAGADETTLVASGAAAEEELRAFVAALRPVTPAP
ncbi:DUF4245 domain-containing protein [Intrasporangium sp. DVR]|uniref:DUF4245 domain-containing protein n=1 Tax=Intrasporangium sp. DVR TaxID=3127867 RepID=UPI00313A6C04